MALLSLTFGPPSLLALRRSAPKEDRPFRLPAATLFCSLAFIMANIIIYWCGWQTNRVSLGLVAALGLLFVIIKRIVSPREPLDLAGLAWLVPYGAGLALISAFGNYPGGTSAIPPGWDIGLLAIFSLFILALSIRSPEGRLPKSQEIRQGIPAVPL